MALPIPPSRRALSPTMGGNKVKRGSLWARAFMGCTVASAVSLVFVGHLANRSADERMGAIEMHLEGFAGALLRTSQVSSPADAVDGDAQSPREALQYDLYPVCGGCRHAMFDKSLTCAQRAKFVMRRNSHLSEVEALARVARQNPDACGRCDPSKCNNTKYWRYDATAPDIVNAVTHRLPSIPKEWRLPESAFSDVAGYLRDMWDRDGGARVLFEFNPSVVILTPRMLEKMPNLDLTSYSKTGEVGKAVHPAYLASYRVSSEVGCFDPSVWTAGTLEQDQVDLMRMRQNYLGLALLWDDLTMVEGSDIVVDIETELAMRFPIEGIGILKKKKIGKHLVDFRLFVLDDDIFLNMNGPPVYVVPLKFSTPKKPYQPVSVTKEMIENSDKEGILLPNMFGDAMEITLGHDLNTIYGSLYGGKNFAIFQAEGLSRNEVLAEIQVFGPHIIQRVQPSKHQELSSYEIRMRGGLYRVRKRGALTSNATISEGEPDPSFRTLEELWFDAPIHRAQKSGGACCVRLDDCHWDWVRVMKNATMPEMRSDYLLVGVGHNKVPYRPWMAKPQNEEKRKDLPHHSYFSFFYAFEPSPPYEVRARSGMFCLPFATPAEEGINVYNSLAKKYKLNLMRKNFHCPKVHFVSDIVENAVDNNNAIISYGINDCTPRMVEIHKSEIARLLFTNLDQAQPGLSADQTT